jgi:hypothetical protein
LFEAALGIEAEPLVGIQADYNMLMAKRSKSFADRLAKIRQAAAIL